MEEAVLSPISEDGRIFLIRTNTDARYLTATART